MNENEKVVNVEEEDTLDKILNDLCGCADCISHNYCDDELAESIDRIGTRFRKYVEKLTKEEK